MSIVIQSRVFKTILAICVCCSVCAESRPMNLSQDIGVPDFSEYHNPIFLRIDVGRLLNTQWECRILSGISQTPSYNILVICRVDNSHNSHIACARTFSRGSNRRVVHFHFWGQHVIGKIGLFIYRNHRYFGHDHDLSGRSLADVRNSHSGNYGFTGTEWIIVRDLNL